MKIIITNTVVLNTGDAAILQGTIDILTSVYGPNLQFVVFDQQAETAKRYYPGIDFRPVLFEQLAEWSEGGWLKPRAVLVLLAAMVWRSRLRGLFSAILPQGLRDALDELATADLVLSAGGTYLVPYYRILPKLFDLAVAIALGRPVALFTQSVGPLSSHRKRFVRAVLSRVRLVLVRDPRSRENLIHAGVRPDRIHECADAAFALSRSRPPVVIPRDRPLRIAVSVRDWPFFDGDPEVGGARYRDAVADLVRRLIEEDGAEVTFLSTCQGVSEYWTDDSEIARAIVDRLPERHRGAVRIDQTFHSPSDLMDVLEGFDAVVATRMHVAILALSVGVPVLPIAYEFKTVELFGKLGMADRVQDIAAVSGAGLHAAFGRLATDWSRIAHSARKRIEVLHDSALASGLALRDRLEGT